MKKTHRDSPRPLRRLTPLLYVDAVAKAGSIRKAAEALAITPSALNRRILALEEAIGAPVFERLARGVRLNTAGELLLQHVRAQAADMARVRSQIADLSGVRRGHVALACSESLLADFLPRQIEAYRAAHPAVTFAVLRCEGAAAGRALAEHEADLALVFDPERFADFQTVIAVDQPVFAVMAAGHPLAGRARVRLRDCLAFPLALPAAAHGVRALLEALAARSGAPLDVAVQSDSADLLLAQAAFGRTVAFETGIGLAGGRVPGAAVRRPVDPRDLPAQALYMGQLRGRVLPVAAARFADRLAAALAAADDAS